MSDADETGERRPLVLVADDDGCSRCLVREALEAVDLEVEEAGDGRECLRKFEERPADLVLLDLYMPELDGLGTGKEIRGLPDGQNVPIVLMTGADDLASIRRAYEGGATDFILKPVNAVILGQRILHILKASRTLKDLVKSERSLRTAQRLARVGSWEWEIGKENIIASEECCRILGCAPRQSLPLSILRDAVHPEDRALINECLLSAVRAGRSFRIDHRLLLPDGAQRHVHAEVQPIRDKGGKVTALLGSLQDTSEIREAQQRIQFLAYYDCVTGLPNRVLFLDRVRQAIAQADRHETTFAVLFLDLDRFKRINDTLGHEAGDHLLHTVGKRLQACLRKDDSVARPTDPVPPLDDTIARLGGDEFTILLPAIRYVQNAAKISQRILNAISAPLRINTSDVFLTGSIGIALFPGDGRTAEELLKNADTAMYAAKEHGKNNYHFFSRALATAAMERLELEGELRQAFEKGDFCLHYQPKIDLASGRLVGCEALLRWKRGGRELMSPAAFYQVAMEAGLMPLLDSWVLREACLQMKDWLAAGKGLAPVAVNISNETFHSLRFVEQVAEALADANATPAGLELELTENVIMEDTSAAVKKIEALQRSGIKVSIDDFGTGYSSLGYLKDLPIDHIKIDRSFVMGVPAKGRAASLTRAIISIGHALGIRVIAEGVETEEQLAFLRECGCSEGQGYLFARPADPRVLAAAVERGEVGLPVAPVAWKA